MLDMDSTLPIHNCVKFTHTKLQIFPSADVLLTTDFFSTINYSLCDRLCV